MQAQKKLFLSELLGLTIKKTKKLLWKTRYFWSL